MLNPALVNNEPDYISPLHKQVIIMLLKKNTFFQLQVNNAGDDLSSRIDAAQSSVQAQMLNALVRLVQQAGPINVSIRGDEDAVWYNVAENVAELTTEMFFVLYNWAAYLDPETGGSGVGVIPGAGVFGDWAAVGQRPCLNVSSCYTCGCSPCSCKLSTCDDRRKPLHWLDVC